MSYQRGTLVNVIDVSALQRICQDVLTVQYGLASPPAILIEGRLVAYRSHKEDKYADRDIVILGEEGVGFGANNFGLVPVPTYVDNGFTYIPVHVGASRVAACVTDELVDLADVIRVFGSRLSGNFQLHQGLVGDWRPAEAKVA